MYNLCKMENTFIKKRFKDVVLLVILKSCAKLQIQLSRDEWEEEARLPTHECTIQMQTTRPDWITKFYVFLKVEGSVSFPKIATAKIADSDEFQRVN